MLSALMHGNHPGGAEVAATAVEGTGSLDEERAKLYIDLVLSTLNVVARKALEAEMHARDYEYQSDFAKKYVAEGRVMGHADALFAVLGARGITITDDVRAQIVSCDDSVQLKCWLERAATASDAAEIFSND